MGPSILRHSRIARRGAAASVLALAGLVAAMGIGSSARATTVEEPATIARQAYFTYPLTQITPPVLTTGFPPATACLVAGLVGVPQICGPDVQALGELLGLSDGLPIPESPDGEIAQPVVLPGTTPVGMLGGQQRYTSLVQLALPVLPEGHRFASLELVFRQSGLSFALESPALRAIVLAVMLQVEERDPEALVEGLTEALTGDLVTDTVTGIEACPALEEWSGGDAQAAAADGTRLPDADCILGTTGVHDPAEGTWTFDLTFAAQAWTEGAPGADPLPNEGILLRAVGAPNLAYGDPDLSTNWLVSLGDSEAGEGLAPVLRYSTVPVDEEPVASPPVDPGPSVDLGSSGPSLPPLGRGITPSVPAPRAPADLTGALRARFAERDSTAGDGYLPGWVWLGLPLGALGTALFAQSLTAAPAASRRRPGALSQLVASREARASTPSPRS